MKAGKAHGFNRGRVSNKRTIRTGRIRLMPYKNNSRSWGMNFKEKLYD